MGVIGITYLLAVLLLSGSRIARDQDLKTVPLGGWLLLGTSVHLLTALFVWAPMGLLLMGSAAGWKRVCVPDRTSMRPCRVRQRAAC